MSDERLLSSASNLTCDLVLELHRPCICVWIASLRWAENVGFPFCNFHKINSHLSTIRFLPAFSPGNCPSFRVVQSTDYIHITYSRFKNHCSDLSGSSDGSIRLWEWGVGQPLFTPRVAGQYAKVICSSFCTLHLSYFVLVFYESNMRPHFPCWLF